MLFRARRQPDSWLRRRRSLHPRLEALEIRLNPSATQLVAVSPPPANVKVGQPFGVTLAAEDASGNIDSTFSGNVTLGGSTDD